MGIYRIPYSGTFWIGANFRIFRMMARHTKMNTTKSFTFEILMPSHFERGRSPTWYVDRAMALCRYFKPLDAGAVPDPSRPLPAHVSPGTIKDANEAVRNASQGSSKIRGKYAKFTPEQNASIGEYALLHGSYSSFFDVVGSRNEAYFGSALEREVSGRNQPQAESW